MCECVPIETRFHISCRMREAKSCRGLKTWPGVQCSTAGGKPSAGAHGAAAFHLREQDLPKGLGCLLAQEVQHPALRIARKEACAYVRVLNRGSTPGWAVVQSDTRGGKFLPHLSLRSDSALKHKALLCFSQGCPCNFYPEERQTT